MKAMILAAGFGTRLRPLTEKTPKALVPILGKPMAHHVISSLIKHNITDITINTHHLSDQIEKFVRESSYEIPIHTINETDILETAGGIPNARKMLKDSTPVIVHNVDIYSTIDLTKLYRHHTDSKAEVTVAVKSQETTRPYLVDKNQHIIGHRNKKNGTETLLYNSKSEIAEKVNCGVYVISQTFLDYIVSQPHKGVSITTTILQAIKDGITVQAYDIGDTHWYDIGTQERIEKLEKDLVQFSKNNDQ